MYVHVECHTKTSSFVDASICLPSTVWSSALSPSLIISPAAHPLHICKGLKVKLREKVSLYDFNFDKSKAKQKTWVPCLCFHNHYRPR